MRFNLTRPTLNYELTQTINHDFVSNPIKFFKIFDNNARQSILISYLVICDHTEKIKASEEYENEKM